jgi:hypothetical protein
VVEGIDVLGGSSERVVEILEERSPCINC